MCSLNIIEPESQNVLAENLKITKIALFSFDLEMFVKTFRRNWKCSIFKWV